MYTMYKIFQTKIKNNFFIGENIKKDDLMIKELPAKGLKQCEITRLLGV